MGKRTYEELSDEELMSRYKLGEAEAFQELYGRYSSKIYGFAIRRLGRGGAAEDVFQETFLRLHRFRGRYDPSLPFVPWIFTITRNAVTDHLRKRGIQDRQQSELQQVYEEPLEEGEAVGKDLKEGLGILSAREREVLILRLQEDLPFDQVAAKLGMSAANARQIVSRAIKKLKAWWV